MSPLALDFTSNAAGMLGGHEELATLNAGVDAVDAPLAELPVGAAVAPVSPVLEGVGGDVVARGAIGAAADADLDLDVAVREVGAAGGVGLLVRVVNVVPAHEVADHRAFAVAVALVDLDAHLGGRA